MGLFGKKLSDEELIAKNIAAQQAEATVTTTNKEEDGLGDSKVAIEVSKLKAQMEGAVEQRKAVNERFSRNSEEMGELRSMIVETNKAVSRIEAATTRAIDMVESVKPDQLMIEVRKQDSKAEALKANIESNEMMMSDLMKELKEMRKKMDFYKGVEQVAKMNEEIKQELISMKKLESVIERHSNKVESIFLDVEKRYAEIDKFQDITKDLKRSFEKLQGDVDKLRVKIDSAADKKEVVKLLDKFKDFEKHTTNLLNLIDEKTKNTTESIDKEFKRVTERVDKKLDSAIKKLHIAVDEVEESPKEQSKSEKKEESSQATQSETNKNSTDDKIDENASGDEAKKDKKSFGSKLKGIFGSKK